MKNLTREEALKLHRQMWSDMQRDLGDNPIGVDVIIRKPVQKNVNLYR